MLCGIFTQNRCFERKPLQIVFNVLHIKQDFRLIFPFHEDAK